MMTDRKQSLQDLVAKVEAGEIKDAPFWKIWRPECEDGVLAYRACDAANGSLDAAKALHEAVLPGWISTHTQLENKEWISKVVHPPGEEWPKWVSYPSSVAKNPDPARAWLIAILKALAGDA